MSFYPFPKGPYRFPYVLLITIYPIALVAVYYSTFLCDVILVLWGHQKASDGVAPLEVGLDAHLTTNVFETFIKFPGIRFNHMDVITVVVVGSSVHVVTVSVLGLCVAVSVTAFSLESVEVHVGYLHLSRAPLMCSPSLFSS